MIERAVIKSSAKKQLKGKWGLAIGSIFVANLIPSLITGITDLIDAKSVIISMIFMLIGLAFTGTFNFGICKLVLNYATNRDYADFSDIFSGFKIFLKVVGLFLLITICTGVGFILLIIPGIIIALMFSQAIFILVDDNEKSITQCLRESSEMMKGHKFEYFVLQLSFLGWAILSILTVGIGLLWLIPYQEVTFANYYLKLKNSNKFYYFPGN